MRGELNLVRILNAARAQHFRVSRSKDGHVIVFARDESSVAIFFGMADDRRAVKEFLKTLQGMGLEYPPRRGRI